MVTYAYRCSRDGDFTVAFPLGLAAAHVPCAVCGGEAPRIYTPPSLTRTPRPLATAIERAERSAETPEVVSELPARLRSPRRQGDPARARLPKP